MRFQNMKKVKYFKGIKFRDRNTGDTQNMVSFCASPKKGFVGINFKFFTVETFVICRKICKTFFLNLIKK